MASNFVLHRKNVDIYQDSTWWIGYSNGRPPGQPVHAIHRHNDLHLSTDIRYITAFDWRQYLRDILSKINVSHSLVGIMWYSD